MNQLRAISASYLAIQVSVLRGQEISKLKIGN